MELDAEVRWDGTKWDGAVWNRSGWDGMEWDRGEDTCRVLGSGGVGGYQEVVGEPSRIGVWEVNGGVCGR